MEGEEQGGVSVDGGGRGGECVCVGGGGPINLTSGAVEVQIQIQIQVQIQVPTLRGGIPDTRDTATHTYTYTHAYMPHMQTHGTLPPAQAPHTCSAPACEGPSEGALLMTEAESGGDGGGAPPPLPPPPPLAAASPEWRRRWLESRGEAPGRLL